MPRVQIAKGAVDPEQQKEGNVDVIADVAAMEEQAGADCQQDAGHQGPGPPDVTAEAPGHRHDANPGEHREEAGRGIIVAKEEIGHGIGMKEKGAMHHGVMFILACIVQVVGIKRMQTLVMAHRAHANIDKAQDSCDH